MDNALQRVRRKVEKILEKKNASAPRRFASKRRK
jgi:hypothetical protein